MELPPAGRRGSFLLVALLLLISILLEQYWLVRFLPWLSDLGGVQPMIVFLDIPLRLPVIDWIPVGILFLFFYLVVVSPELSRQRQYFQRYPALHSSPSPVNSLGQKGWAVFAGWWLMLFCLAAGGGLYYLLEDQLPKQVRNGIDSFGIRADISIPYPGEGIIHLHGGMIMLISFLIGGRFFLRRTRLPQAVPIPEPADAIAPPIRPKPQPVRKKPQSTSLKAQPTSSKAQSTRVKSQPPQAKPQTARPTSRPTPQPRIQLPPEPTPATVRPCIVTGVLEPQ